MSRLALHPAIRSWCRQHTPGLLSSVQLQSFFEDGFVVLPSVFSDTDMQPTIDAVTELVDRLANRLAAAGRIRDTFPSHGFSSRLTKLDEAFPGASVLLHKNGVLPPAIASLWSHPHLLSVRVNVAVPHEAGALQLPPFN